MLDSDANGPTVVLQPQLQRVPGDVGIGRDDGYFTALTLEAIGGQEGGYRPGTPSVPLILGFAAEPRSLLPNTIVDWTTNNMLEHIYDRLVDRDPKTYKPIPMLATSWKVVDNTTWEFALRTGVKFHNGEPFDAQSVKASLDYIPPTRRTMRHAGPWSRSSRSSIPIPSASSPRSPGRA